jgi:ketosteroid isomerase-like protein
MTKNILPILIACLIISCLSSVQSCYATGLGVKINSRTAFQTDSIPPPEVMEAVEAAIYACNNFKIESVAGLYTPNAVVTDDEPPYSWNGPTAGIQWINSVENACKELHITKLKATINPVNIFHQSADNVYLVVPVSYTGNLPGKAKYTARGAFTFVLRLVNGKWMIKSQAWMPGKGV